MSETPKQQTPDITQLWRDWLTQSERQVNTFLAQALNQEGSARTITGYMEVYAAFQRMLAEGMQQYLSFFNVPSRTDVARSLEPGWLHVIVGRAASATPEVRAWRIEDGVPVEELLTSRSEIASVEEGGE